MFSTRSLAAATAAFALFASSTADYNPSGKGNTAVYWGAGADQKVLSAYCYDKSIDIIPVAFVNAFPPQANGLIGVGMASNTVNGSPKYAGPGYAGNPPNPANDELWTDCSPIANALYDCQQHTKTKFLLSLGGAVGNYNLNNASDGVYLANLLWGAFGPWNSTWVANGGIRPFDVSPTETIEFDGFDFDIEITPNSVAGYTAAITQLRTLFAEHNAATGCNKEYLITGAPQCPIPDANMSDMIAQVAFDIVWPQFYNNPGCSARNWVTHTEAGTTPGFNFDKWESTLAGTASSGAQLYIGLLGGPQGTSATYSTDYLNPTEVKNLISAYAGQQSFGGVMIWDAVSSDGSVAPLTGYKFRNGTSIPATAAYYDVVKDLLGAYATPYTAPAPVCTPTSSSTSSCSTPTSTSSSTSSSSTTTSSSSYPATPTSTSSSTSSTTSSSSSYLATPTSTSSSVSTTTSSSSSYPATPTSTSSSASTTSSSSSSYPAVPSSSSSVSSTSSSAASISSPAASTSSSATTSSYPAISPPTSPSSSSSPPASTSSPASSSSSPAASTSSLAATTSYPGSPSSPSYPPSSSSSPVASSSSAPYYPSNSIVTSSPFPTTTSPGGVAVSTSSYPATITETYTTTTLRTITSCAATVTNCPANQATTYVVTDTIEQTTTYCPGNSVATSSPAAATSPPVEYTTSTVYTTTVYTITSCAPTVTNCPAKIGQVTTDTIIDYTTVCPVTAAAATTPSVANTDTYSTTTTSSTTTRYVTIKVVASTATLVPYPSSSALPSSPSSILTLNKGAAAGTLPAVYLTTTTATPSQFTGAASSSRGPVAVVLAMALGAVALLL